jgi:hypothetical protein
MEKKIRERFSLDIYQIMNIRLFRHGYAQRNQRCQAAKREKKSNAQEQKFGTHTVKF